jgi:hypothetical protein
MCICCYAMAMKFCPAYYFVITSGIVKKFSICAFSTANVSYTWPASTPSRSWSTLKVKGQFVRVCFPLHLNTFFFRDWMSKYFSYVLPIVRWGRCCKQYPSQGCTWRLKHHMMGASMSYGHISSYLHYLYDKGWISFLRRFLKHVHCKI